MMRYVCQSCKHGDHKLCHGVSPPPPGMFGGSECVCDGKCGERVTADDSQIAKLLNIVRKKT